MAWRALSIASDLEKKSLKGFERPLERQAKAIERKQPFFLRRKKRDSGMYPGTGRRHEPSLSMSDKIYCVKSEKIGEKESKIHKWQQLKWGDLQSAVSGTCVYKTYCNVQ